MPRPRHALSWQQLLGAAALALAVVPVLAQDVIHTTEGGRLRGKIVRESRGSVVIDTPGGRITVPRDQIARVERDGDVFRELERRKGLLAPYDADGWFKLGGWCQEQGLYPEAIDCFNEVLRIDRDHREARFELGYRRHQGQWVTEEDYFVAKGYVRWEGRWVTPGEREKLEQGLVRREDGSWGLPEPEAQARAERPRPVAPKPASASRDDEDRAPAAPVARRAPNPNAGWSPMGGQVGQAPLSPEERAAQLEQARAGGGWKLGWSSKYYDFFSNGDEAEVQQLGRTMDLMCEEYVRIFKFEEELTRPFPVHLYRDQQEFMSRTGQGAGTGGFYDGQKIVGFHGRLGDLTTMSVLFHEGTHQFQGLVMGRNMWRAKIWLIEGLAVYFEASEAQGKRLQTGAIPASRLAHVKRAITSGSHVKLRDLIRMDQAQFGALHYAHAWSLIYFLVNGTKGGKKRFVEYWEKVKAGHEDQVALFEELFNKPLEEIEAAWKDYVLQLAPR